MKDWKTWAIVVLAAWCAWLTYFPVVAHLEKRERIRRHEEYERTEGTEWKRKFAEMKEHQAKALKSGKMVMERLKNENPERYSEITNMLFKKNPEQFKRAFKDPE